MNSTFERSNERSWVTNQVQRAAESRSVSQAFLDIMLSESLRERVKRVKLVHNRNLFELQGSVSYVNNTGEQPAGHNSISNKLSQIKHLHVEGFLV